VRAFLAVTDPNWLRTLASAGASEVNFWQPRPTSVRQPEGTPWIFKVRGTDRIAGFGFFSYWTVMPLTVAWETFGEANGTQSYGEMVRRVRALRHSDDADDRVGCVVLADVILLDPTEWIAAPADWKPNIVRGAGYDLSLGEGARVWNQLRVLAATTPRQSPTLSVSGGFGPEIIQHEENGLLVDTRSADGIATAVRRILEDKDLEKRLRRNAPKRARDFSTETAAARYIGIFRGVLHTDDLK
jgi:putative restriction endonuclease